MKKTITDLENLSGKRVFLRLDLNVPLDEQQNITDDTRIIKALPTIKYLLMQGARLIICSHLGRPKGQRNDSLSLLPVAKALINFLPLTKIKFSYHCIGTQVEKMTHELKNGEILVLENIRYYPEEEKNDVLFAKRLARLADVYVTDAFGASHRHHASVEGVARLLPNAMGFLMGQEVNTMLNAMQNAARPFVAVLGGAKVADKIYLVLNLMKQADAILIGGGMAYTFLKALGAEVGKSLVDDEKLDLAKEILMEAERYNKQIYLPIDHKCALNLSTNAKAHIIYDVNIPENMLAMDIGPKTIKLYSKIISKARTVIWNGPMGVFEFDQFANGTHKIAKAIAKVKGTTIVGGGDSIASIKKLKLEKYITHLSTGGGASLQLLQGDILPGIEVIENK